MIPRIVNSFHDEQMNKCIYLDSDLIVEGNIAELFNIDINGYCIAGVADCAQIFEKDSSFKDNLGIPSLDSYINSGVLLYNIKEINNCNGLSERLEKAGYRDNLTYSDQDAINSVLYGRIKLLPLKYNVMTRYIYNSNLSFYNLYGNNNITEARKNPFIIHYITGIKPWMYKSITMAEKWWKYVKMQDNRTYLEYIKPFLNVHRIPLFDKIKDETKAFLKRLGIYQLIKGKK